MRRKSYDKQDGDMAADIDIDLADRQKVLEIITAIPARIDSNGMPKIHNSGVYVVDIPKDPTHGCASIDYHEAEQRGYVKIDLLNVGVYSMIRDNQHYQTMLSRSPPWNRLWQDPDWAKKIIHIGNYTELLRSMKPDSIPRMAAFISVIRPGKAHLQQRPWAEVFDSVWDGDNSRGFIFKKSHAISYAVLVALHMNLLDTSNESD
jgi:hypothetical protein